MLHSSAAMASRLDRLPCLAARIAVAMSHCTKKLWASVGSEPEGEEAEGDPPPPPEPLPEGTSALGASVGSRFGCGVAFLCAVLITLLLAPVALNYAFASAVLQRFEPELLGIYFISVWPAMRDSV